LRGTGFYPSKGNTPWPRAGCPRSLNKSDGEYTAIKKERPIMHLLLLPVLANVIWIGGGSAGLILIIVVVVLLLR
jgi:hypothetical protein